jgi:dihydrofolate reductase
VPAPHALDRLLITRLHTPAECDVFLSEYRTAQQVEADGGVQGAKDAQRPLKQEHWRKEEHAEMERWLGGEVGRGEQEEKATRYEFQMWTRR